VMWVWGGERPMSDSQEPARAGEEKRRESAKRRSIQEIRYRIFGWGSKVWLNCVLIRMFVSDLRIN
jgi:hypothetical protein